MPWSPIRTVHSAFYEFPSPAAAEAALRSDAMRGLIAKFDAAWGERVIRDRNIVEVSETLTRETEPRAAEGA